MASLDVAVKGPPAVLYPPLLVARYLERSNLLPVAATNVQQDSSLSDKSAISLKLDNGETFADEKIVSYCRDLVNQQQQIAGVDEWVERSKNFANAKSKEFRPALAELDKHLTLRSYMVGYSLTLADVAVWATIRGNHVASSMLKQANNNITRWFKYIEAAYPWIPETIQELSDTAAKEKEGASFDIQVRTKGPLVTRFPPEPSGFLHIGHAKAIVLNEYFAHREPGGKLICRFDDTNPSKESMEFHDAILHDLELLGIRPDTTSYSSDYFQQMYELAIKIIKDGNAFADDAELGKGDEDRKNRLPSKRRDLGIEETLRWFEEMKSGSDEGRRWCLRARIAYDSPNGTMRDPVIYRCNATPHHRTGSQWNIYPTYDFCAPILDSLEGVTLALRTNEYRDRNVQYAWFQNALGLRPVEIWDFSRMNFVRTVLSKRKLTRIVADGKVWGWDDPRMPTVRGMLRRGMTVEALREFMLVQGPSRNILNLEWGALWALNKKYTDPIAARFTAVAQDNAVHCRVIGADAPKEETVAEKPKHAKNMEVGMKKVWYKDTIVLEQADAQSVEINEEVTLMNWGNAIVREKKTGENGTVSDITFELHLEGDFKKTKKKLTWLAAIEKNLVPVTLYEFDLLITKDKLEKDDELEQVLTPVTEFKTIAYADCNVAELPKGSIIQFDRKGFFKLDDVSPPPPGSTGPVFYNIPTGRA
ncbi:glutamyl-tRNA synthetase [Eremomyces bilateralis CBS 781.70]|uniref:glutamate--tRNA ligase n=1 Tax=Eremomyces bilateralis CBS 781.70 TaxID=1392243 RepID=A0A6G1FTS5_9PEZI|nr:glutamyl-tRNA synthetase [Eremomyces bilateralis CBS 781.70]KAF1809174.1 glutamyl-tRNA synthetase [Eremomyces bilateralis CBS 781.70]